MHPTANPADEPVDMQACIEACFACYRICLDAATNDCLERGGRHAEGSHISLMLGCAQMCRTAAEFMIMCAKLHHKVCGVCAEVCEACAVSCQQLDGMDECVNACRHCAALCRRMALGTSAEI